MIGDNGAGYLWKLVIRCGFGVEISTVGVHNMEYLECVDSL